MPLDFDILLGSSPPILSHSPIFSYFNSLASARAAASAYCYDKKLGGHNNQVKNWQSNMQQSFHLNGGFNGHKRHQQNGRSNGYIPHSFSASFFKPCEPCYVEMTESKRPTLDPPSRPCIIIRHECHHNTESIHEKRHKKRVVFADDKGLDLTHVRVMSEPSSCPPRWGPDFLELITRSTSPDLDPPCAWQPAFPQPAANYVEFREKLERDNVALENVIVKEGEDGEVTGTVKVRNLSFNKEVIVRWTADNWKTYEDVRCLFNPSGAEGTSVVNVFDTFRFSFPVPRAGSLDRDGKPLTRISFCVCFKALDIGQEFWDSNGGANFALEAPQPKPSPPPSPPPRMGPARPRRQACCIKTSDALTAELESWSEFASWNHLTNDMPYW